MQVHYQQHAFGYESLPGKLLDGRLLLNDGQRELLARLVVAEDEDWYLDDDGERLPAEQLFARSPWSCPGRGGPVKLLCRFLDLQDGRVRFDAPDSYMEGGLLGLFDWLPARD